LGRLYFKGEKMKELIAGNQEEKKMSSVEIATLMDKQHKNVMRDIKSLIEQQAITGLSFEPSEYKDASGKTNPMYLLDFEATMTLITGYDAKRRSLVIKRWTELEKKEADGPSKSLHQVLSDPAAMRDLLLTYTEKVISLESTVAEQAPKVEALNRISTADGMLNITNAAKTLQIHPNQKLFRYMQEHMWIYRRAGGKNYVGYQQRIQQGLLSHKVTTVQTSDGREKIIEQVLVTPKGLAKLASVFTEARA
jgi:Rha family phage regulatory protein